MASEAEKARIQSPHGTATDPDVPPGYKRTEVGVIPEDWEVRRLGEIAEIIMGQSPPSANYNNVGDGLPLIQGNADIVNRRTIARIFTTYVTKTCYAGDIIMTVRAPVGQIAKASSDACLGRGVCAIRYPNNDYLYYCLINFESKWAQFSKGSTFDSVNSDDIKSVRVSVPPTEAEQRAIAEALSDVDRLIEALDKLIAKKRAIKQAAMQQLLTGKTRLPGFSGEWETKRLGEIATIEMGRTPSRNNPRFWGHGHIWLSIADLQSKVIYESKEQITDLAAATMKPIPKGTLLMSFKLSIGRVCFAGCELFTNEAICSFTDLQADADYLYYVLGQTDFSLYGKQAVKGYTLNSESLKLVEIKLPSRAEQRAIATVLSDMDAEIEALERRQEKVKQIKQGMMQQLLTGRIRLVKPKTAGTFPAAEARGTG